MDRLEDLKKLLTEYGEEIDSTKTTIEVNSLECISSSVPNEPGVYWIGTTMPTGEMQSAISQFTSKAKKIRVNPPRSTKMIKQTSVYSYVVYSGTEEDINKRLKQHLFNEGSDETGKLGCKIDEEPFSNYSWSVSFQIIDNYELRYAVEAWWRLNKGWPIFCLR